MNACLSEKSKRSLQHNVPSLMLSFEQYSLSVKNTRSKLGNLGIITYIKRESKEDSIARRGAGVLT